MRVATIALATNCPVIDVISQILLAGTVADQPAPAAGEPIFSTLWIMRFSKSLGNGHICIYELADNISVYVKLKILKGYLGLYGVSENVGIFCIYGNEHIAYCADYLVVKLYHIIIARDVVDLAH